MGQLQLNPTYREKHVIMMTTVSTLQPDRTLLIKLANTSRGNVVNLKKDLQIAKAKIQNPQGIEAEDSPGGCLQFLRHYNQLHGTSDINIKGSCFAFGPNREINMASDRITNFKI